jgi:hypothetical protein
VKSRPGLGARDGPLCAFNASPTQRFQKGRRVVAVLEFGIRRLAEGQERWHELAGAALIVATGILATLSFTGDENAGRALGEFLRHGEP